MMQNADQCRCVEGRPGGEIVHISQPQIDPLGESPFIDARFGKFEHRIGRIDTGKAPLRLQRPDGDDLLSCASGAGNQHAGRLPWADCGGEHASHELMASLIAGERDTALLLILSGPSRIKLLCGLPAFGNSSDSILSQFSASAEAPNH